MHPDYLLRMLTSQQFEGWQTYYQLEPFGEWRADLRAGIVASAAVSPHVRRAPKPADFMPTFEPRVVQTLEEQKAQWQKAVEGFS